MMIDNLFAIPPQKESDIPTLPYQECARSLPHPWSDNELGESLRRKVQATGVKVVAIDDDPTGCQTVHDVPLLLEWTVQALVEGLRDHSPALFVLSNSRAMEEDVAAEVNRVVAEHLKEAAEACQQPFVILSRSDSTLRGHYRAETDVLARSMGGCDGIIISPCFFEAGRFTVAGVHWVKTGDQLVPAAQTEFAQDATFGFAHSYLPAWVEEKTAGASPARDVLVVSLRDIREGGPSRVAHMLQDVSDSRPIVLDAWSYQDLDVVVSGLLEAEAAGRRFLYRTAAGFLRVRAGIGSRPMLGRDELLGDKRLPGLVVVGSYVPRSTAQLRALLAMDPQAGVELRVQELLNTDSRQIAINLAVDLACDVYDAGRVPVIYTSRELVTGSNAADSLRITNVVSDALVEVVKKMACRRRFGYFVAKGGITSHELAMKALGARRTRVLGQIEAGVPVWRLGQESVAPGATYVVFPGNVGETATLRQVVEKLQ